MLRRDKSSYHRGVELQEYCDNILIYLYDEDVLHCARKVPDAIDDNEYLYMQAFNQSIDVLEKVFNSDHASIINFLFIENPSYPFNMISPFNFVKSNPRRSPALLLFTRCMLAKELNKNYEVEDER